MKNLIKVLALVIFAAGCQFAMPATENSEDTNDVEVTIGEEITVEESEAEVEVESSEVEEESVEENTAPGSYESYAPEKLAAANNGRVVLFFHAPWCPSCKTLNSDIEANLSAIPGDVTILKTDYDSETELKQKYGVTYQHTMVQVDADGNMIKKWSGSYSLSEFLTNL